MRETDVRKGAGNLLRHAAGLGRGDRLVLLYEDPRLGFYGAGLAEAVLARARALGIDATAEEIPFCPDGFVPDPALGARMRGADCVLFLARAGDQMRFRADAEGWRAVVCYALDRGMLGSPFGRADHRAFVGIRDAVNAALARAGHIRVTCPLGTDFSGPGAAFPADGADVRVTRFPLSVFTPVPAGGFSGRVAQHGFLTGTGSRYFKPYGCPLQGVLMVHFEGNRITGFEGSRGDVAAAGAFYDMVSARFGIERCHVHSWHAGIHPGCAYGQAAGANLERWSGGAFGNPRLLHLHTCGAYPPGEISLNVLDPSVELDGVAVWDRGVFHPLRLAGGAMVLERFAQVRALFESPARDCGLDGRGRLSMGAAQARMSSQSQTENSDTPVAISTEEAATRLARP